MIAEGYLAEREYPDHVAYYVELQNEFWDDFHDQCINMNDQLEYAFELSSRFGAENHEIFQKAIEQEIIYLSEDIEAKLYEVHPVAYEPVDIEEGLNEMANRLNEIRADLRSHANMMLEQKGSQDDVSQLAGEYLVAEVLVQSISTFIDEVEFLDEDEELRSFFLDITSDDEFEKLPWPEVFERLFDKDNMRNGKKRCVSDYEDFPAVRALIMAGVEETFGQADEAFERLKGMNAGDMQIVRGDRFIQEQKKDMETIFGEINMVPFKQGIVEGMDRFENLDPMTQYITGSAVQKVISDDFADSVIVGLELNVEDEQFTLLQNMALRFEKLNEHQRINTIEKLEPKEKTLYQLMQSIFDEMSDEDLKNLTSEDVQKRQLYLKIKPMAKIQNMPDDYPSFADELRTEIAYVENLISVYTQAKEPNLEDYSEDWGYIMCIQHFLQKYPDHKKKWGIEDNAVMSEAELSHMVKALVDEVNNELSYKEIREDKIEEIEFFKDTPKGYEEGLIIDEQFFHGACEALVFIQGLADNPEYRSSYKPKDQPRDGFDFDKLNYS